MKLKSGLLNSSHFSLLSSHFLPALVVLAVLWCGFLALQPAHADPAGLSAATFAQSPTAGFEVKRATANVSASQTDSSLVTAVSGKSIKVIGMIVVCGGSATNFTLNSKGSGAGTAISPVFANGANGGMATPLAAPESAWFSTAAGEALTCTTGSGSTTAVQILYVEK